MGLHVAAQTGGLSHEYLFLCAPATLFLWTVGRRGLPFVSLG